MDIAKPHPVITYLTIPLPDWVVSKVTFVRFLGETVRYLIKGYVIYRKIEAIFGYFLPLIAHTRQYFPAWLFISCTYAANWLIVILLQPVTTARQCRCFGMQPKVEEWHVPIFCLLCSSHD